MCHLVKYSVHIVWLITIIINALLVVSKKFIWKNEIFYFIPYVPFKIIGGQISHTWVMFPHLGIHIQSFTHLLVLNYNFLTLRVCLLLISQQTFLYDNIFILYNVWNDVKYGNKKSDLYDTDLFSYLDILNLSFMNEYW